MSEQQVKCVVWDLDDTVWDGILLEDESVTLKPRIEEVIKTLDSRGILHSIASRNEPEEAMDKLRAAGLAEYFLYPEIGWNAKSVSVQRIVETLNIGYDAVLFVDDQPFERDEVANAHNEVWCLDSLDYLSLLDHPRLKPKYITSDSARRRAMYLDDEKRKIEEDTFEGPNENFLRELNMVFTISEAGEDDLLRAEELTYRTNQLNATGIRYTVESLDEFRCSDRHKLLVCDLTDKYGSYGKIGMALIEKQSEAWCLKLLLFSCRVMSKGVGTVFLTYLRTAAKEQGARLLADFRETPRNRMMYISYAFAGFNDTGKQDEGMTLLENDLSNIPPYPDYIKMYFNVNWSE